MARRRAHTRCGDIIGAGGSIRGRARGDAPARVRGSQGACRERLLAKVLAVRALTQRAARLECSARAALVQSAGGAEETRLCSPFFFFLF